MTSSDIQIKTMYEVEGLTPSEISDNTGFQEAAIKAKLMSLSSKYRKACGQEDDEKAELNFSDEQLIEINQQIYNLAVTAESEKVRADLCKYIRDDKKGRKDISKAMHNTGGFNMLVFNDMLSGAKQRMMETILPSKQLIDVSSK